MKSIHVVYSIIMNEERSKVLMVLNRDNNRWTLPGERLKQMNRWMWQQDER